MATVVHPESGRVTASFAAVAKHYGVSARPCPPRRGNRKGVVEKANNVAAQRFWRTLADDVTPEQAQQLFDPGAPGAGTCGCARPPTAGPPSPFSPPASRCTPGRPLAGHDHSSLGNPRAGAGRQG